MVAESKAMVAESKAIWDGGEAEEIGKLFIGGLSWETTQESFTEYFSKYGTLIDSVIMKDPTTQKQRGFGFCRYRDTEDAAAVLADVPHVVDGKTVDPKPCTPKKMNKYLRMFHEAKNQTKVFLGGLPHSATEESVKLFFRENIDVEVAEVTIMYCPAKDGETKGTNRGFGFVTFKSMSDVNKVCNLRYITIGGKTVEVKHAQPKSQHSSDTMYAVAQPDGFLRWAPLYYNPNCPPLSPLTTTMPAGAHFGRMGGPPLCASPLCGPIMGGPLMGGLPVGGPTVGGPLMGGPTVGGPLIGGLPTGAPPVGGTLMDSSGPPVCGLPSLPRFSLAPAPAHFYSPPAMDQNGGDCKPYLSQPPPPITPLLGMPPTPGPVPPLGPYPATSFGSPTYSSEALLTPSAGMQPLINPEFQTKQEIPFEIPIDAATSMYAFPYTGPFSVGCSGQPNQQTFLYTSLGQLAGPVPGVPVTSHQALGSPLPPTPPRISPFDLFSPPGSGCLSGRVGSQQMFSGVPAKPTAFEYGSGCPVAQRRARLPNSESASLFL